MTCDDFLTAVHPKVQGSWNLHHLAPRELDFFVMLSSGAGIAGSRGQGNYAAGNTYQDALAHFRRSNDLAATTLDVGMILGVGFVAENVEAIDNLKNWGFIGIREEEFHLMLASAITGTGKAGAPIPAQIITGLGTGGMIKQSGANEPFWFSDAKFAHMRLVDTQSDAQESHDGSQSLHALLHQVTSLPEAADVVCKALTEKLAKSMMMAIEDLDPSKPVNTYGVDSLVAVELRNWVFREVEADVSVFEILSNVPISTLSGTIARKSRIVPAAVLEAVEA